MTAASHYAIATAPEAASEIDRLQAENIALQSILQGLCMGLSQISDLHREVVIQACDYARRTSEAQRLQAGAEAFDDVVAKLRTAVMDRYRSY